MTELIKATELLPLFGEIYARVNELSDGVERADPEVLQLMGVIAEGAPLPEDYTTDREQRVTAAVKEGIQTLVKSNGIGISFEPEPDKATVYIHPAPNNRLVDAPAYGNAAQAFTILDLSAFGTALGGASTLGDRQIYTFKYPVEKVEAVLGANLLQDTNDSDTGLVQKVVAEVRFNDLSGDNDSVFVHFSPNGLISMPLENIQTVKATGDKAAEAVQRLFVYAGEHLYKLPGESA